MRRSANKNKRIERQSDRNGASQSTLCRYDLYLVFQNVGGGNSGGIALASTIVRTDARRKNGKIATFSHKTSGIHTIEFNRKSIDNSNAFELRIRLLQAAFDFNRKTVELQPNEHGQEVPVVREHKGKIGGKDVVKIYTADPLFIDIAQGSGASFKATNAVQMFNDITQATKIEVVPAQRFTEDDKLYLQVSQAFLAAHERSEKTSGRSRRVSADDLAKLGMDVNDFDR